MAQIQVTIVEGRNLKKQDLFSENDAYVEIYLNDKRRKQKTKVKNNSKNPDWNETFVFDNLQEKNFLYVDVYDKDVVFDDKIGSIIMDLKDLAKNKRVDGWYNLPSKYELELNGQIHLIIEYQPAETST